MVPTEVSGGESKLPEKKCRKAITIASLGVIHVYCCLPLYLFSLFLPQWAFKKGISGTWVGFITGFAFLTGTSAGFINILLARKITPTLSMVLGILLTGCFTAALGILEQIENPKLFLGICLILRGFQGFGILLADSNVYVVLNKQAPTKHLSVIVAAMDLLSEMSLSLSSLVGGLLYEVGGYTLPFWVLGAGSIVCVIITLASAARDDANHDASQENSSIQDILSMFLNWKMITYSITSLVVGVSVAFLNGMIQPYLQEFHLTTVEMGLLVLVPSLSSSITFPIWGLICDKMIHLERISILGNLFLGVGFVCFGPVPGMPFKSTVSSLFLSMVVCGLGMSASMTSIYTQGFRYLRSFLGAVLGGVFIDYVGYKWGSLILGGLQVVNMIIQLLTYFMETRPVLLTS